MDDADVRAVPFGGLLERMRARFDPPRS